MNCCRSVVCIVPNRKDEDEWWKRIMWHQLRWAEKNAFRLQNVRDKRFVERNTRAPEKKYKKNSFVQKFSMCIKKSKELCTQRTTQFSSFFSYYLTCKASVSFFCISIHPTTKIVLHTGANILNLSKNSYFKNLNFHKIHIFQSLMFTKFTFSKSHFSQNSRFQNLIFHKIHIYDTLFSQNSHFSNFKSKEFLDKKLGLAPVCLQ